MNRASVMMALLIFFSIGCSNKKENEHGHPHDEGGLEPLSHTVYSNKTELFVEFMPLVVGSKSNFASHFTILGDFFKPLTKGEVSVSLIVNDKGIKNSIDSASSPGIFRLALVPKTAGKGKLIFDIKTATYTDQIIINNITVYRNSKEALAYQVTEQNSNEITYLKEQAWRVDFANKPVLKTSFNNIIKSSGQILPAVGDEITITANSSGILKFANKQINIGSQVQAGTRLFSISGGNLTENNINTKYKKAKATLDIAKTEYERAEILVKDKIISQVEYLEKKLNFEQAQIKYNTIANSYSASGQSVSSLISGYIKNILVNEGQFVEEGTPITTISRNKKLLLQANVSQKYFSELSSIENAKFKMIGSNEVYDVKQLNGKLISYGKSISSKTPFIPVLFEIDNLGKIVSGAPVEIYLQSTSIPNTLIIPKNALMEEQGNFYVYVQTKGESFEKREIKIGASDGENVQVLDGVNKGERIVTKGAYQIKLASASGELPAHGHEH